MKKLTFQAMMAFYVFWEFFTAWACLQVTRWTPGMQFSAALMVLVGVFGAWLTVWGYKHAMEEEEKVKLRRSIRCL